MTPFSWSGGCGEVWISSESVRRAREQWNSARGWMIAPLPAEQNWISARGPDKYVFNTRRNLTWKPGYRVSAVWDKPAPHSHTATALHVVRHCNNVMQECNNVTFCKVFILISIKIPGLVVFVFLISILLWMTICINKHFFSLYFVFSWL